MHCTFVHWYICSCAFYLLLLLLLLISQMIRPSTAAKITSYAVSQQYTRWPPEVMVNEHR